MAFGKVNKNKKMTQADLQGSEENKQVDLPSKLISESDVELPEYRKEDEDSNLSKSIGIKAKRRKGKLIIISAVVVFILLIIASAIKVTTKTEVVVTEEPEELIEQPEEIIGETDVSGLIRLNDRNKDRTMIELHDDYIDLTILHPSDYLVKELSSEGVNVLSETIEEGSTRYSLQKSKLTGIVPIFEMKHKTYTPYTIRMQMGSVQEYLHQDEEYIKALSYMLEMEKEVGSSKKIKVREEKEEDTYYKPFENENIDYLNYCPVKVVEHVKEAEISEENTELSSSEDINTTDSANKPNKAQSKKEEINEDKINEKPVIVNGTVQDENTQIDTKTTENLTSETTTETETKSDLDLIGEVKEIDLGDGNTIKYRIKNTPIPCESEEYLQSRLAFEIPLGYKVKQDNALVYKQEQVKLMTEESLLVENKEEVVDVVGENNEDTVIEEQDTNKVTVKSETVDILDSKGNKINTIDKKLTDLFAEVTDTDKDLTTLAVEYDYSTFKLRDREVKVNSLLLDYNGIEIKYYEFKFMLGDNEAYIAVYGELDNNINYILEDIRYLIDSISFG